MKKKFGIITGAAGLIGTAHCEALIENNIELILLDIQKKKIDIFAKKLKKKYPHREILYYNVDVSDNNKLKLLSNHLKKKKIFVEYLINNACIDPKPNTNIISLKDKSKQWDLELAVGLRSVYLLIEIFSEEMKKNKKGKIINMASDLSVIAPNQSIYKKAFPNFKKPATYSAIKHGVVGLTKYYASLLAQYNITCNSISPSGVDNNQPKGFKKELLKLIPLKRMSSLDDIKNIVSFLASDKSNYITGQNLIIDGGRTII